MGTLDDAKADARQLIAMGRANNPKFYQHLVGYLKYNSRDPEVAYLLTKLEPLKGTWNLPCYQPQSPQLSPMHSPPPQYQPQTKTTYDPEPRPIEYPNPSSDKGLKIAAMVLGIIGGLGGFIGALFALTVGTLGSAFGADNAGMVIGLGWLAMPFALLGILGGALALAKPKEAGTMMIVSAIVGTVAISAGYLLGGPLLLIAGILALVGSKKKARYI